MILKKAKSLWMLLGIFICVLYGHSMSAEAVIGGSIGWTDANGVVWQCIQTSESEAILWGCSGAPENLVLPTYIRNENNTPLTVTGIVTTSYDNGNYGKNGRFVFHGTSPDSKLKSITFPSTVSYVEQYAFFGSEDLEWVTFSTEHPVDIGSRAFAECEKLKEITFPIGGKIEEDVLADSASLERILNIPEKLDMGYNAAPLSLSLKELHFAQGLTEVGGIRGSEFDYSEIQGGTTTTYYKEIDFSAVTKVTLPSTVKTISSDAFNNLPNLITINLPEGLETIESNSFEGCAKLTGFTTLPSTVTKIWDRAFMGCKNLKLRVDFPEEQTTCGYQFKDSGIESISFKKSLWSLYGASFSGCENLKEIYVEAGNPYFFSEDGVLYAAVLDENRNIISGEKSLFTYPAGKSWKGSLILPQNVYGVGAFAFDSCKFTEIHLPVQFREYFSDRMSSLGDTNLYDALCTTPSSCVFYVVKNSYADMSSWGEEYSQRFRFEQGPAVPIKYNLNGGKNHSSNPQSIPGGSTIKLKNPTRAGYTFLGWKECDDEPYEDYITEYTPYYEKLYEGVTFVAYWSNVSAPKQVGKVNATNAMNTSMKVSYPKVSGAKGYQIQFATDKGFKKNLLEMNVKGTSATVKNLKSGKTYYIRVRAYKTDGSAKIYGEYSKSITGKTISVPAVSKVKAANKSAKKLTVAITPVKGAAGYQVMTATDAKFKKNKKTTTTKNKKVVIRKLKKGKTYYVKARAYKLNKQKKQVFGPYSKKVKVKIKK